MTPSEEDEARRQIWLDCQNADPGHDARIWRSGAVICDACNLKVLALEGDRTARLEVALHELESFARRNAERARKYVEFTKGLEKQHRPGIEQTDREERIKAEARHHEAVRFHLVVKDRVREALQ